MASDPTHTSDLRAAAEKVDLGEWYVEGTEVLLDVGGEHGFIADCAHGRADEDGKDEAAYIAACSPNKIIALLDEIDRLRAELAQEQAEHRTARMLVQEARKEAAMWENGENV